MRPLQPGVWRALLKDAPSDTGHKRTGAGMSTLKPRTKRVAPWKLRIGMHIAPLRQTWEPLSSPYAYATMGRITEITKGRSVFTGATVWRVKTSMGEQLQYHGKCRTLQAELATILTD